MNDLLDIRIGRASCHVSLRRPFIRFGWNPIPTLLRDFGWLFLWVRGRYVIYMRQEHPANKNCKTPVKRNASGNAVSG